MKRLDLHVLGAVDGIGSAMPLIKNAGDAVLVKRGYPRFLVVGCPCGCGERFPINLDERAGPAWHLYEGRSGLSVFPSVWRETGCRSHYILWNGRIYLFSFDNDEIDDSASRYSEESVNAVRAQLHADRFTRFTAIASTLGYVPWDVLAICRNFVAQGAAHEGRGHDAGAFQLITHQSRESSRVDRLV